MKTITKTQFRILACSSYAAAALSIATNQVHGSYVFSMPVTVISAIGATIAYASIIPTLILHPIAKPLNLALWAFTLAWPCISSTGETHSPLSTSLNTLFILLSGIIIALMHFSPASAWFTRQKVGDMAVA